MELELNRIDYCSVGATLVNCLTLLPATNYKEQHRVVVGDQDGILQIFSMKKDELFVHVKTLPSERIQCIRLGGSANTTPDKIFIASDNKVKAYNRKGKIFLTFTSNLTEPIRSMYIMGNDMILCGNHVYNHYRDCKDVGSYLCGDTIVDVAVLCPNNGSRMVTILGCSGRVLRILEHCRVRQSVELESVPTVLHVPRSCNDRLFCGMTNGRVVLIRAGPSVGTFNQEMIIKQNEESSAITTIDAFDLTGDNKLELIVGRRDGTIEVFILPGDENSFDATVQKIYSQNFNESISCVRGGIVDFNGCSEVIVCTYTGSIFGLSTKCPKKSFSDATINNPVISNVSGGRMEKLREEISELEQKVQKECERYKISTQNLSGGFSAIPMLPINSALNLSEDDASYSLTIEAPSPIEFALLQCNTPIQFIDVEKSSAVVSFSRCDPTAGNHLLASYRCQDDVNRLDLKFRTVEGAHGRLQAFITPNIQPKVAQMKEFLIKPLSLHMRSHSFNFERPHNQLTLKGVFSNAEIHNWISNCIPEVPEKLQSIQNERSVLYFKNVLVHSELLCEYTKGEAVFKSENITTISIIKDFITKEATKRRTKLEISLDVKRESVVFMINLMETNLKQCILNNNEYRLVNNLIDLDLQDDFDVTSLGAEYSDAISRKDQIIEAFNESKYKLDTSIAIIARLYIDFHHLNGIEVKQNLTEISNSAINIIMEDYSFKGLLQFFFDGK